MSDTSYCTRCAHPASHHGPTCVWRAKVVCGCPGYEAAKPDVVANVLDEAMGNSIFAPKSLGDIRCRLTFIEASECNCDEGPHENALHDLANDDTPVLLAMVDRQAAEITRLKTAAETLGSIINRTNAMVLDITGLHHLIDEDGDGDWAAVWERLAEMRQPQPVTYPGGTQWAIKWPLIPEIEFWGRNEGQARYWMDRYIREAMDEHPNRPELWPELVSAHITWQVVE